MVSLVLVLVKVILFLSVSYLLRLTMGKFEIRDGIVGMWKFS